jgi:hypothetical protein
MGASSSVIKIESNIEHDKDENDSHGDLLTKSNSSETINSSSEDIYEENTLKSSQVYFQTTCRLHGMSEEQIEMATMKYGYDESAAIRMLLIESGMSEVEQNRTMFRVAVAKLFQ